MNNSDKPAQGFMREPSAAERQGFGIGGRNGSPPNVWVKGMTKREAFAMAAMQALTTGSRMMKGDEEEYARLAVKSADALLKELEA